MSKRSCAVVLGFVLTLTSCGYGLNTGNDEDRAAWQAAEDRASEQERADARRGVLLEGLREGSVPMAVTSSSTSSTTTTEPPQQPFTPAPPTEPPTTTTTTTTTAPPTTTTIPPPPPPEPFPATPVRIGPRWCYLVVAIGELGSSLLAPTDRASFADSLDEMAAQLRRLEREITNTAAARRVRALADAVEEDGPSLLEIRDLDALPEAVAVFMDDHAPVLSAYVKATDNYCFT
ncbi:MAG: hypothetical protein KDA98_04010 [Acidimicrobiales bacterium]|nr:hypothetical protein [Acidimicrobiales bacterium]